MTTWQPTVACTLALFHISSCLLLIPLNSRAGVCTAYGACVGQHGLDCHMHTTSYFHVSPARYDLHNDTLALAFVRLNPFWIQRSACFPFLAFLRPFQVGMFHALGCFVHAQHTVFLTATSTDPSAGERLRCGGLIALDSYGGRRCENSKTDTKSASMANMILVRDY